MSRVPVLLLILASVLVTPACEKATPAPGSVTTDSAGVQIIETSAALWEADERWTVAPTPSLEIGVSEGEPDYEFSRIAGALRLEDGTIVVANGGTNELRFYGPDGRHLRTVGRTGQGPGEFEYIRALLRCGPSSIHAFDLSWQLNEFSLAGELVRQTRLQEPGSLRTPYALSCSSAGQFVITGWGAQTEKPQLGFYQATSPVYVLDAESEMVVHLGEFISSERMGYPTGSGPHPFGRSTTLGLSTEEVYVGSGGDLEVQVYGFDGSLRRILRGPRRDLTLKSEHIDRYRADQLSRTSDERRPAAEVRLREMPMPERFPAYSDLLLDPDGHIWVKTFLAPGDPRARWEIFSPNGEYLGEIEVPAEAEVVEIGSDHIVAVHRDDLDVERVRVYQIKKGSS